MPDGRRTELLRPRVFASRNDLSWRRASQTSRAVPGASSPARSAAGTHSHPLPMPAGAGLWVAGRNLARHG
jgi:hypothetical protein